MMDTDWEQSTNTKRRWADEDDDESGHESGHNSSMTMVAWGSRKGGRVKQRASGVKRARGQEVRL